MPTTKKPLKRYSILDRCFSNTGRNYTLEGLRDSVDEWMLEKDSQSSGISIRQLREEIAFMKSKDGWDAPCSTILGDGKKRFYLYEDQSFSIKKRPVKETQIEELKILMDALDAFEKLPQFLHKGNNKFDKGKEYFGPLYRAFSQRKQVKMTYTPFSKESKTFILTPVYFKQYNNNWFLIVLVEKGGFVTTKAFDRIENLVVLDSEIPEDITFDAEEYFDQIVGVSRPIDGEIEEMKIQLAPPIPTPT